MILPTYRRLTEEDLEDAPKGTWKSKLLYAINLFFQQVYYGLDNQLTPEQNDLCQVKTFALVGSSTPANNKVSFPGLFSYQPRQLIIGKITPTDNSNPVFAIAPYPSWTFTNGIVNILGICGLTDGVAYSITVEIRWPPVVN